MRNKFNIAVIVFFVLAAVIYLKYKLTYENNFIIVKSQKLDDKYSFVYMNEADYKSIYVLNEYQKKHFKRDKHREPVLKIKRISFNDIKIKKLKLHNQNVYVVTIDKNAYMYGNVLHFQNYFWKEGFKEIKVFLKIE